VADAELIEPFRPRPVLRGVGSTKRAVMHAGALPRRRRISLLDHMQLRGRTALSPDACRASGAEDQVLARFGGNRREMVDSLANCIGWLPRVILSR